MIRRWQDGVDRETMSVASVATIASSKARAASASTTVKRPVSTEANRRRGERWILQGWTHHLAAPAA